MCHFHIKTWKTTTNSVPESNYTPLFSHPSGMDTSLNPNIIFKAPAPVTNLDLMVTLVLKILSSLELGISVRSGGSPGLNLAFGISKGYAKGSEGSQGLCLRLGKRLGLWALRVFMQCCWAGASGGSRISIFLHHFGMLPLLHPARSNQCLPCICFTCPLPFSNAHISVLQ